MYVNEIRSTLALDLKLCSLFSSQVPRTRQIPQNAVDENIDGRVEYEEQVAEVSGDVHPERQSDVANPKTQFFRVSYS